MAGINNGKPEVAVGEPIRLGSDNDYEIEQHPASDKLLIRDTANGKVAYVRRERGGQIGGDGVLVKALKEGKPMNDKGRTYDTIQEAERQATGWVFVPPGTFNESVSIDTKGLTLQGSGRNKVINGGVGAAIDMNQTGVTVKNLTANQSTSTSTRLVQMYKGCTLLGLYSDQSGDDQFVMDGDCLVANCHIFDGGRFGINTGGGGDIIVGNHISTPSGEHGINSNGSILAANNIVENPGDIGIRLGNDDCIAIGNRVIGAPDHGIQIGNNFSGCIVANNRVSDSGNGDINDIGVGTLLDGNLTGASN